MAQPDSKRAIRRHHADRKMNARYKRYVICTGWAGVFEDGWRPKGTLRNEDIRQKCSCDLCNPNRFAARRERHDAKYFARFGWREEYEEAA